MKFIDFFAGIGGFRRGMELAGNECVGFCEFDKFAVASYTLMHLITDSQRETLAEMPIKQRQKEILKDEYRNGEWYANDIRSIRADEIPRADCWCFGFPCQDISIAGKQKGFNGHRSSLFFAVTRLIRDLEEEDRPKYLFIENVKNLLSINRGGDFLKLLIELDEIGYDAEWQLLNSKDFGVPQNRERVFIIGHLRGRSTGEVFPVEGTSPENSVCQIGNYLRTKTRENPNQGRIYDTKGIAPCLNKMDGGGREPSIVIKMIGNTNPSGRGMNGNVYGCNGIAPNLTTNKGEGNKIAIPVLTPDRAEKRQNGRRFKDNGEPMFALTSQDKHGVGIKVSGHEVKGITEISNTLNANDQRKIFGAKQERTMVCEVLGGVYTNPSPDYNRGILDGASRTLKADSHPAGVALKIREATKKGYSEAYAGDSINFSVPNSKTRRGRVGHSIAQTLDTSCNQGIFVQVSEELTVYAIWYEKYQCYIAIRKLTPKECFRLQGWTDDYFEKAAFVNSDSQLYKQAGNGVTVNVIQAIAEKIGSDTN